MLVELRDHKGEIALERAIPPYDEAPGMIMWGSRIFVYTATTDRYPTPDNEVIHVYRETFMHHITV